MYICLCRGVTDRHIRQAVVEGAHTMARARQETGLCSQCGRCGEAAREVFEAACTEIGVACRVRDEGAPAACNLARDGDSAA